MKALFAIAMCLLSLSAYADGILFFSGAMGHLTAPQKGAVLIYAGNHGLAASDENHKKFVGNSMSLFRYRDGYRLYVPESQDRGLTVARAPVTFDTYHFMGHTQFHDVWGLENTLVRWEWKGVVRELLEKTGPNDELSRELERINDLMRSYFMAQGIGSVKRLRPSDNIVAAIGGAHLADGVMIKRLSDRGVPVNYAMERSFAYGDFQALQEEMREARWKEHKGRREIQELAIERLVSVAKEIEQDPTKAYTPGELEEVPLESNRKLFFESRRRDAREFLAGYKNCLNFIEELGHR